MLRSEFGAAVMLLTRVPAGWLVRDAPAPARCLWAYPLVGAWVGALGAAVFAVCTSLGMPTLLASFWTLAALALLTGGLHEDGLADVADGFGGGRTAARKLEIMRDSRVGSYGVLALILATAIRGVALAEAAAPGPALIAACALARGSMVIPVMLLAPARGDGLGASLAGARGLRPWIGLVLAVGIGLVLWPAEAALAAAGAACLTALAVVVLARSQLGGFTGDVLGGCAVAVECTVLSVLAGSVR